MTTLAKLYLVAHSITRRKSDAYKKTHTRLELDVEEMRRQSQSGKRERHRMESESFRQIGAP